MSDLTIDWAELTKETSLWQIYRGSRSIPSSLFNQVVYVVAAITLTVLEIRNPSPSGELKALVLKWGETGLGFAITILGFLMAGFTVFATLSKPQLLLAMQKEIHVPSKLTYLKYNFFTFVRVFVYYLWFCAITIMILLIGESGPTLGSLLTDIGVTTQYKIIFLKTVIVFTGTAWMILLLSLKSFVFNIYHVVMTSLRWEAEGGDPKG